MKSTIIRITHDKEEVLNSDRVLVYFGGKIIEELTPSDFFKREDLLTKVRINKPISLKGKL